MNKNKILVPLSNNSYEVIIQKGIITSIGEELNRIGINKDRKILVISNTEISNLFGYAAIILAAVNIFGGFLVTQRMLAMYKKKKDKK